MSVAPKYDRVQIILHWLIALIIFTMFAVGFYMIGLPKQSELPPGEESVRAAWFLFHKSLGLTAGILIILRFGWRLTHKAPALPDSIVSWQRALSSIVHWVLYGLMLAVPTTGYLQSIHSKYDTHFWGFTLPRLVDADKDSKHFFGELHELFVFSLIALLILHIGAAVMHRIKGENLFKRMSLFSKD